MDGMNQIIDRLYLGDKSDAQKIRDSYLCESYRIIDVRNLIDEDFNEILNLEIAQKLAEAIDFHLQCGREVLVFCDCGIERSPIAIAVYLCLFKGMTMNEAYELIKEKRPSIFRRDNWIQWR